MPRKLQATTPYCGPARLCLREEIGEDLYRIEVEVPADMSRARPGQFLHVRVHPGWDPLLRRPISLHDARKVRRAWRLSMVVEAVGRGTHMLAAGPIGAELSILGPLGRPFTLGQAAVTVLVGGGVGIPPLHFLARRLRISRRSWRQRWYAVLGARTRSKLCCADEIGACGVTVYACTEDGTKGLRSRVSVPLRQLLEREREVGRTLQIYACGPKGMLRAVAEIARDCGATGELSMEQRMACGLGVCRACVCRVADPDGTEHHATTCRQGPVFGIDRVVFDAASPGGRTS